MERDARGQDEIRKHRIYHGEQIICRGTTLVCNESNVVHHCNDEHAEDVEHVEVYHEHKVKVICNANTIVEPRTVVIHSFDALVTDIAMLRTRCFHYFARRATLDGVDHLEEFLEKKKLEYSKRYRNCFFNYELYFVAFFQFKSL